MPHKVMRVVKNIFYIRLRILPTLHIARAGVIFKSQRHQTLRCVVIVTRGALYKLYTATSNRSEIPILQPPFSQPSRFHRWR